MESDDSESSGDDNKNGVESHVWLCLVLAHHIQMESKESSTDDNRNGVRDARQQMSRMSDDKETLATRKHLGGLQHEAFLTHQKVFQGITSSPFQFLDDHFRLQKASKQLTKKVKRHNLDAIVQDRVAAMIGSLNIYTNENLKY